MGKSSTKTTQSNILGQSTTSNPYVVSSTNNSGTSTSFKDGTALNSVYNFVNRNIDSLLDEYLNPNINSTTNQTKLNTFANNLNATTQKNLENNIINPLSRRNMIRSSHANDLYKNLSEQNVDSISSYISDLLTESENNAASKLNTLLNAYMQGYNVIADNQQQSLDTSVQNATRTATQENNPSVLANMQSVANIAKTIMDTYTSFAKSQV